MTAFRLLVSRICASGLAAVVVWVCTPDRVAAQQGQTPKTQKIQKQAKSKAKAKAKAKTKTKVVLGKALGNTLVVKDLASRVSLAQQLPTAWVRQQVAKASL